MYKIPKPPFYAAWSTPILHDTLAGLKINTKCQVIDRNDAIIPGLYACGECAGGFALHGRRGLPYLAALPAVKLPVRMDNSVTVQKTYGGAWNARGSP